jgi:hypothetical protein
MTDINAAWTDREINHEIDRLDTQFPTHNPAPTDPYAASRALIMWPAGMLLFFWGPGCLAWWVWA